MTERLNWTLPAEYFSAFSFCLDCCVYGALSVGWKLMILLYCGTCSLWVVGLVAFQLFLVRGANVCVPVGGAGCLLLECNEVSSNEWWDVNDFRVTLGSLYIGVQGCVPVLLENLRGMSCSGTGWPLSGAWFQCRYGGIWWAPVN